MAGSWLSDGKLLCSHCQSEYTHWIRLEAYIREGEDSWSGFYIGTEEHGTCVYPSSERIMKLNPSGRRNGIVVTIDCEGCGRYSFLTIAQHKGTTDVELIGKETER